jgi:hypothetical protein
MSLELDLKRLETNSPQIAESVRELWSYIQETLDGEANTFLDQLRTLKGVEQELQLSPTKTIVGGDILESSENQRLKALAAGGAILLTSSGSAIFVGPSDSRPDSPSPSIPPDGDPQKKLVTPTPELEAHRDSP